SALVCLFYSVSSSPAPCTLFAYTTLFRSVRYSVLGRGGLRAKLHVLDRAGGDLGYFRCEIADLLGAVSLGVAGSSRVSHPQGKRDRKSTRLNSSHGSISYAVFCFKKIIVI